MVATVNQHNLKAGIIYQGSELTQPLFTDKFTIESNAEKVQLYEKYRQKGDSLYELRVIAQVWSTEVHDGGDLFDSAYNNIAYTMTFSAFSQAKAYAKKIYADSIKYPNIPILECKSPSASHDWAMMLGSFHIVEISPTKRESAIMSAYVSREETPNIPWESDEDPTELGGQAA